MVQLVFAGVFAGVSQAILAGLCRLFCTHLQGVHTLKPVYSNLLPLPAHSFYPLSWEGNPSHVEARPAAHSIAKHLTWVLERVANPAEYIKLSTGLSTRLVSPSARSSVLRAFDRCLYRLAGEIGQFSPQT